MSLLKNFHLASDSGDYGFLKKTSAPFQLSKLPGVNATYDQHFRLFSAIFREKNGVLLTRCYDPFFAHK
jgi:hypothetical protein